MYETENFLVVGGEELRLTENASKENWLVTELKVLFCGFAVVEWGNDGLRVGYWNV
jgi:hypothetical protein